MPYNLNILHESTLDTHSTICPSGSKDVIDLNFGHGVTELQLYLDEKSEVMLNTITASDNSDDLRDKLRAAVKVALEPEQGQTREINAFT